MTNIEFLISNQSSNPNIQLGLNDVVIHSSLDISQLGIN